MAIPSIPSVPAAGNVRQGITQADYEAYINWNHPGDKAALARAGNGQYDGPERWTEDRQTKVVLAPVTTLATAEPMPSPAGNWGGDPFGFPTWQDWWNAAFGSPAVAWGGLVANAVAYVPDYGRRADGWIPSTSWGFDGDREFCDLPSSMYHLGGDPLSVTAANYDPLLGFLRTDAAAAGAPMGDGFIGEITSPWANTVYGQDVGPAPGPGNPDWIGPGGPDGNIIAGGLLLQHPWQQRPRRHDSVLALEAMTWITVSNTFAVTPTDVLADRSRPTIRPICAT
ncbi:MAG: hypothetical protein U1F77_08515 [Kiritimatiellia bacterium]